MAPLNCPICGYTISCIQINYTEGVYLCPNVKCTYPIGAPNLALEFVNRDYKSPVNIEQQISKQNDVYDEINYESFKFTENFIDSFLSKTTQYNVTAEDINEMDLLFETLQSSNPVVNDIDCLENIQI